MSPEEFKAMLARYGITPEQFSEMAQSGVFDESAAALHPQMQRATDYADQPMPQGQMVSGYYVPTSPLANLAGGAGRAIGAYQLGKLQKEQGSLIEQLRRGHEAAGTVAMKERDDERKMMIELLRRLGQQQQQTQPWSPEIPIPYRRPEGW
jgi:hypothetical protein